MTFHLSKKIPEKTFKILFFSLIVIYIALPGYPQHLTINEIMSSNATTIADEDGDDATIIANTAPIFIRKVFTIDNLNNISTKSLLENILQLASVYY